MTDAITGPILIRCDECESIETEDFSGWRQCQSCAHAICPECLEELTHDGTMPDAGRCPVTDCGGKLRLHAAARAGTGGCTAVLLMMTVALALIVAIT